MTLHSAFTLLACLGNLAFAIIAWLCRARSRLAVLLAVLFFDVFAWNFADLAYQLSGARGWQRVDRAAASLMPALALHVVLMFVGRAGALQRRVLAGYFAFAGLALWPFPYAVWWKVLLGGSCLAMLYAGYQLARHLRQTRDTAERSRSRLILFALVIGTSLGSSDLWSNKVGLFVPPLSSLGMLIALGLFGVAVLRLDLLGSGAVPRVFVIHALGVAVLAVIGYLGAVRWLDSGVAATSLGALTALVIVFAAVRERGRAALVAEERARRLTALGRLSEQLAHDLRNPLAALKGALQFLSVERAAGRSLDAHGEFLELMLEQTSRLERNLTGYQRLARVEPVLTPECLNTIVGEVLVAQRLALALGVELRSELEPELPPCLLDKDLVVTALENLLRNAMEALPAGGTISIRTERVTSGGGRPHVSLAVEDDGAGMDARQLARAGEEFFSTKPGGSGLGLSFAMRVARAHGGQLELRSELGAGTCIRLLFPSAPA
jgi:two-component system, NtrC family, sensor histidine kinase HydH